MTRLVSTILVFWIILVALSCVWNVAETVKANDNLAITTSRGFFDQIVMTRAWNAAHGGVYVPVTESTRPNEYLDDPRREIVVDENLTLTKINPAFMTRQISEIVANAKGIAFHITSLDPIRPANAADELETEALISFEQGEPEFHRTLRDNDSKAFFYMAPLYTEASCLQCHAAQGYVEGDVRGGISITVPLPLDNQIATTIGLYIILGIVGLAGILFFGHRMSKAYKTIERQAVIDGLTGIANRRFLTTYLEREFGRSRREGIPLSIIMSDIDHFKAYNDTYGHQAGDECLKKVTREFAEEMQRPADLCARYGGEEFVMVLPNTDARGARAKAETVRMRVENLGMPGGIEGETVTISCGVATYSGSDARYDSNERLLSAADRALYEAKAAGRNRVESVE